MAKDPAFLFYYQDFLVGTQFLTNEEVGIYIKILCHLADKGKLSMKEINSICSGEISNELKSKFFQDKNCFYFNKRLQKEVIKRKNYSQSRALNRLGKNKKNNICKTYVPHMENENENENINKKEDNIIYSFALIWDKYPNKDGRKQAEKHFKTSIKTKHDWQHINTALDNYLDHLKANQWKRPKNGSTWFNNWQDWVNWREPIKDKHTKEQKSNIASMQELEKEMVGKDGW